jgi:hypothetical protein
MDDQITALIYGRVSTDEQADEGVSLPARFSEGRRYVSRQESWIFGDEFQDIESGRRDDRPDYQRLLLTVRGLALDGRRIVVVVASLDRLGRDVAERVRAWKELKDLGATIHSVREGGIVSEFTYNILASVAQEESRKLGERVRGSNLHFIENGWHPVGRVAWGYRWRDATAEERKLKSPAKVLEPHPVEAPYVREAWARRAAGESASSIHQWAKRLPEAARGGRSLSRQAIRLHFREPVFVGRFPDGSTGRWEPLIDPETWDAVQALNERDRRVPAQASGVYPLTGMLRCFRCGSRMAGRHSTGRWRDRTYRIREYVCEAWAAGAETADVKCWATVPARRIEAAVLETVGEMLQAVDRPHVCEAARRAWAERERALRADDDVRRIAALDQAVQTARRRISAASVKFLDGDLDREAYDIVRADLAKDLEAAEEELKRLRGRARPAELPPMDAVLAGVSGWAGALRAGAPRAVRDALAVLIERAEPVRIGHGKYEARLDWTPLGRALLLASVSLAPSPNLISVDKYGKARLPEVAMRPSYPIWRLAERTRAQTVLAISWVPATTSSTSPSSCGGGPWYGSSSPITPSRP